MKKNNFAKRMLMYVLSVILFASVLFGGVNGYTTVRALDGTINQDVSNLLSGMNVDVTRKDNGEEIIADNSVKGALYNGYMYTVRIEWKIDSDKYNNHVEPGDFFWIDISDDYFSFTNSIAENDLEYKGEVIGKWEIKNNKIHCTFTEGCTKFTDVSGYFEATGYFVNTERETKTINLGGVPVSVVVNPRTSGYHYGTLGQVNWNNGVFSKYGNHTQGNYFMGWYLYVNYENAIKAAKKENNIPTVKNVVVKDVLPDDLIMENVTISTPISYPNASGQLTSQVAFQYDLTDIYFTRADEKDFSSTAAWEAHINSTQLTYGVSKDNKTFMANLGNLPGSMKISDSKEDFKYKLERNYMHFSEEELNAMADIYYDEASQSCPVYAVFVYLRVKSANSNGVFIKETYSNSASFTSTTESKVANASLTVQEVGAGILGHTPKTATLTKVDEETGSAIKGAMFKLQKLDGTEWVDYIPTEGTAVRTTDDSGKVKFADLIEGTYRFVETEAASGYDINTVKYSLNQFIIAAEDVYGYDISATNKKIATEVPPAEEENTTGETTTVAQEENTSGETTTAAEEENTSSETTTAAQEENTSSETTTVAQEENTSSETTTVAQEENTSSETTTAAGEENTSGETTTAAGEENTSSETTVAQDESSSDESTTVENTSDESTTNEGASEETTTRKGIDEEDLTNLDPNGVATGTTEPEPEPNIGTGDTVNTLKWFVLIALSFGVLLILYNVEHKEDES